MASSPRPVARLETTVQRLEQLRRELEEAERHFATALSRAVRARILYERAMLAPPPAAPEAHPPASADDPRDRHQHGARRDAARGHGHRPTGQR